MLQQAGLPGTGGHGKSRRALEQTTWQVPLAWSQLSPAAQQVPLQQIRPSAQQLLPQMLTALQQTPLTQDSGQHTPLQQVLSGGQQAPPQG
jgi:hypothetical protein